MAGMDFVKSTLKSLTKAYPKSIQLITSEVTGRYDPVTGDQTVVKTTTSYEVLELPVDTAIYIFPSQVTLTVGSRLFGISTFVPKQRMKIISDTVVYHISQVQESGGTYYVLAEMYEGGTS